MLKIKELCSYLNVEVPKIYHEIDVNGLSTDTRTISAGDVFVALSGPNFDGHDYIALAAEKGASCAIVSKKVDAKLPCLIVADTLKALKKVAGEYKKKFDIPCVAVTGSAGKTTTKEMIAAVLAEKYNVHKTEKNFNNEIGLPLTLMKLSSEHQISVIELGMNNFGEIETLAEVSKPDVGIITNIGSAHIENLGSREGILKAKMEITKYFQKNNILIINGDDDMLCKIDSTEYKIIKVGINENNNMIAFDIKENGIEGISFKTVYKDKEVEINIPIPGRHNVYNALFAMAVASLYNLSAEEITRGIANFKPLKQRMDIFKIEGDVTIINDCYNANPESMKATLDVLGSYNQGEKIAVLGDMLELGDHSSKYHKEVVSHAEDRCNMLLTYGKEFASVSYIVKDGFIFKSFLNKIELVDYLHKNLKNNTTVLVKGSRGSKMEEVIEKILEAGREE